MQLDSSWLTSRLYGWILLLSLETTVLSSEDVVLRVTAGRWTSSIQYEKDKGLTITAGDRVKCIPDLGCFHAGPPFYDPVQRPLSVLPQDREDIATTFLLYTRRNPEFFDILSSGSEESIYTSKFNRNAETKIIVPGWMDSVKTSHWMQDMRDSFLNLDDFNVIIVDWSRTNGIPFAQSVANARVVGAETALLVNFLEETTGVRPESFHIIGHSLGAEIAGYAGERLRNLGRITALDPAGPYFRNVSTEVRLDPTDALFVDAIHADSSDLDIALSREQPTGHVDFYPNSGKRQPGCPSLLVNPFKYRALLEGARKLFFCDHYRSPELFTSTINDDYGCVPVAIACRSWKSFTAGRCSDCGRSGSRCAVMGYYADHHSHLYRDPKHWKYFLKTAGAEPFCMHHYHVAIRLAENRDGPIVLGDLNLILNGTTGDMPVRVTKRSRMLHPGGLYRTMATSNSDLGDISNVVFSWDCATIKITDNLSISFPPRRCKLYVHDIKIAPLSSMNPTARSHTTKVMCGNPNFPIPSGMNINFGKESLC